MTQQPYQTPEADLRVGTNSSKSYSGLRRLPYFLWSIVLAVVTFGLAAVLGGAFSGDMSNPSGPFFIMLAIFVVVGIFLAVLRFRNQGASGWWAVALFVPILNIYASVRVMAYPEGYTDHRKFDTAAKVIIGIFVLIFVLQIAGGIYAGLNPV